MTTQVLLSTRLFEPTPGRCASRDEWLGPDCEEPPTLQATLAYCTCAEQPHIEHGHPGSDLAERVELTVCERHGALMREWEALERIRSIA